MLPKLNRQLLNNKNPNNKSVADWKAKCQTFNEMGEYCKKEGIRLAYHNHYIEFMETEDQIPCDIVLKYTNPTLVTIQMDIWWIKKAGHNPLAYIEKYPCRFELCHIKTVEILANDPNAIQVNCQRIVNPSKKAGFKYYMHENEKGISNPYSFLQKSIDYIKPILL